MPSLVMQCKQMRRNYIRITTALCHLTAVFQHMLRWKVKVCIA